MVRSYEMKAALQETTLSTMVNEAGSDLWDSKLGGRAEALNLNIFNPFILPLEIADVGWAGLGFSVGAEGDAFKIGGIDIPRDVSSKEEVLEELVSKMQELMSHPNISISKIIIPKDRNSNPLLVQVLEKQGYLKVIDNKSRYLFTLPY